MSIQMSICSNTFVFLNCRKYFIYNLYVFFLFYFGVKYDIIHHQISLPLHEANI